MGDQPLLWSLFIWIGIDGDTDITPGNGIIQVGTGQTVVFDPASDPLITTSYYAWWQGDPNSAITQIQLDINPGDSVTANVTFSQEDNSASFWIKNESLGRYNAGLIALANNLPNNGITAEWISEAPTNVSNKTIFPLPRFVGDVFTNAYAEDSAAVWCGVVVGRGSGWQYWL